MRPNKIKTILIGDTKTGKSAFRERFVKARFVSDEAPTIGAQHAEKPFKADNQHHWSLWDTAGEERYRSMLPCYLTDANVILIFVDASRPDESIRALAGYKIPTQKILLELIRFSRDNNAEKLPTLVTKIIPKEVPCAVIFTKSDHEEAFDLTNEEACLSYVTDVQTTLNIPTTQLKTTPPYFVTSAKSGTGINEAMATIEAIILSPISEPSPDAQEKTTTSVAGWFLDSLFKGEKTPRQNLITVPSFDGGRSSTLFQPPLHRKEKPPETKITFDKLGF